MFSVLKRMWAGSPKDNLVRLLGDKPIPQLPVIALKVLSALRDPRIDNAAVAKLIESDPGLSLQILRTVNSPGFGLRRPVDNIRHAIAIMGRGPLETMVLATAVSKAVPGRAPGFDRSKFWRGAARRAATARNLAEVVAPGTQLVSFTAGLLQDMAVPLLALAQGESYQSLLNQWHADGGSLDELERQAFEWDHSLVAGWLCEEWNFPDTLKGAISDHHEHEEAPAAVYLVGLLGDREGDGEEVLTEMAVSRFGACPDRIARALAAGREQSDEIAKHLV